MVSHLWEQQLAYTLYSSDEQIGPKRLKTPMIYASMEVDQMYLQRGLQMMEFTAIARRTATDNAYEFDEEFVTNFNNAASYCAQHPDHYLRHKFATAQEREAWLGKAKAYGKTLSQPLEVRRIKHTDSANPEHGKLEFVIEPLQQAQLRRQKAKERRQEKERELQSAQ